MSSRYRYASRSPAGLAFSPSFWLREPMLPTCTAIAGLVPVLVWVSLPMLRGPLSIPALLIHLLTFGGIRIAAVGLARIAVETDIARQVAARAADQLRRQEAHQAERLELAKIEGEFLLDNPDPRLAVITLFQQILRESKDRKAHSSSALMQPIREESYEPLGRLQSRQRIALQFGILGTFVGLTWAISQVQLHSAGFAAQGDVQPLFDALSLCFTTSVAGIEVAVLLRGLMMRMQRQQTRYFAAMREGTVFLSSLARNAINKDEYLHELGEVQTAVRELGNRVLRQADETKVQTDVIRSGIARLIEVREDLDSFLVEQRSLHGGFLKTMERAYELLSPPLISRQLTDTFSDTGDALARTLSRHVERTADDLRELAKPLASLRATFEAADHTIQAQLSAIRETNAAHDSSRAAALEGYSRLVDQQSAWVRELREFFPASLGTDVVAAVRDSRDTIHNAIEESSRSAYLSGVAAAQDTHARKLAELGELVRGMRRDVTRLQRRRWSASRSNGTRASDRWTDRLAALRDGWNRMLNRMRGAE